jgi:hypothetical protein
VVKSTPQPLYPRERDPVTIVQETGWAPGPVWTGAENLAPTGIRSPDRPARSKSLYRLSYPVIKASTFIIKDTCVDENCLYSLVYKTQNYVLSKEAKRHFFLISKLSRPTLMPTQKLTSLYQELAGWSVKLSTHFRTQYRSYERRTCNSTLPYDFMLWRLRVRRGVGVGSEWKH